MITLTIWNGSQISYAGPQGSRVRLKFEATTPSPRQKVWVKKAELSGCAAQMRSAAKQSRLGYDGVIVGEGGEPTEG